MKSTLVPFAQLALAIEYQRAWQHIRDAHPLASQSLTKSVFMSTYNLGFAKGYTEARNR